MTSLETDTLRTRDFWGALVLLLVSLFFFWRTFDIPLWGGNRAGVRGAEWYNSAAIVPLGIFSALIVLSIVLLVIAIKAGGAKTALSSVGIGWDSDEAVRFLSLAVILFFYVAGLVPRVDFVICSGLLITCLIFGFHGGQASRMILVASILALSGAYAMASNLAQSQWAFHDDDVVALLSWLGLTLYALSKARTDRVLKIIPVIAIATPLILVCAMAFGFRQNVPNRGGLLFSHIEYHYYVTLRPLWRS